MLVRFPDCHGSVEEPHYLQVDSTKHYQKFENLNFYHLRSAEPEPHHGYYGYGGYRGYAGYRGLYGRRKRWVKISKRQIHHDIKTTLKHDQHHLGQGCRRPSWAGGRTNASAGGRCSLWILRLWSALCWWWLWCWWCWSWILRLWFFTKSICLISLATV